MINVTNNTTVYSAGNLAVKIKKSAHVHFVFYDKLIEIELFPNRVNQ